MLVLTREEDESIIIGEDGEDKIEIKVVSIKGGHVKLGIKAPRHIQVHREEIYNAIMESNREAATQSSSVPKELLSAAAKKVKSWSRNGK